MIGGVFGTGIGSNDLRDLAKMFPSSDLAKLFSPATTTTPAPSTAPGSLANALDIGKAINQYQTDYQKSNIPNYENLTGALSGTIGNLFNPYDPQSNYDVTMHGAEMAAGRGIPGSPAAGETTGRLRQADIERRAALGANLLGQEVSWLPKPYDVGKQLLDPNLMAELQNRTAIENARLANAALRDMRYGGGGYSYPQGGYRYGGQAPPPIAESTGGYSGTERPFIDLPPTGEWSYSAPPPYTPYEEAPEANPYEYPELHPDYWALQGEDLYA